MTLTWSLDDNSYWPLVSISSDLMQVSDLDLTSPRATHRIDSNNLESTKYSHQLLIQMMRGDIMFQVIIIKSSTLFESSLIDMTHQLI
jgi:hypothetical protein